MALRAGQPDAVTPSRRRGHALKGLLNDHFSRARSCDGRQHRLGSPDTWSTAGTGRQRLVQALVAEPADEALREGVLCGLPGAIQCQATPLASLHFRIAMLVSSMPLSETQLLGPPRRSISASARGLPARLTARYPGVSATLAREVGDDRMRNAAHP
jgi:hypothetical protein